MNPMWQADSQTKEDKKWQHNAADAPWFDQPNALELLEHRRRDEQLSDQDFELLHKWVTEGYYTNSGAVSEQHIDGMVREMDDLWTADRPIEGLEILDLRLNPEGPLVNLSHAEVVALEPARRLEIRDNSNWRIHGYHLFSEPARAIYENSELIRMTSLIFKQPSIPSYTINFTYGSRQALHQDTAVFHVFPPNYLIGAWLACEDALPDSGPLVYYPRSHRAALFPQFDNYPQTNLRTVRNMQEYSDYVVERSKDYERKLYFAKKGDVFLWHGMLIHGGSEVFNPKMTRRSYVCHYIPPGMDKISEIEGPFNW